jgi:hypothetical protein
MMTLNLKGEGAVCPARDKPERGQNLLLLLSVSASQGMLADARKALSAPPQTKAATVVMAKAGMANRCACVSAVLCA